MRRVIKKESKKIKAYRVSDVNSEITKLTSSGKLLEHEDGSYELFTRESINGRGEIIDKEDYIKFDNDGYPYPNKKDFFEKNHRKIGENIYEQKKKVLYAFKAGDKLEEEIFFLMEKKHLVINKDNPDKYYTAPLWGTILSADIDAIIILYKVDRDENNLIKDIDFNFVCKEEFEKEYNEL